MAPWRLSDVIMAVADLGWIGVNFPIPATCPSGVPAKSAGRAGMIAGRFHGWGRITATALPERMD